MKSLFLFLVIFLQPVQASDEHSYAQGETVARDSAPTAEWDLGKVPEYRDPSTVPESSLTKDSITGQVGQVLSHNASAALIQETHQTRSRFDLDSANDPLFTEADSVIANPEQTLNVTAHVEEGVNEATQHTCTKGYDLIEKRCRWTRVPIKTGTRQEVKVSKLYVKGNAYDTICLPRFYVEQDYHSLEVSYFDRYELASFSLWCSNARVDPAFNYYYTPSILINCFKALYKGVDAVTGEKSVINPNRVISVRHLSNYGGHYLPNIKYTSYIWQPLSDDDTTRCTHCTPGFPAFLYVEVTHYADVPIFELNWQSNCEDLEGEADSGVCEYASKQCVEGPETRIIEGVEVSADCWAEEAVYDCRTQQEDTCRKLIEKGCVQTGSRCISQLEEGHCIKWEQSYECANRRSGQMLNLNGEKPFCLDGHCVDQTFVGNKDMIEALSKLSIFKEMQKDMDANAQTVFKGRSLGCSRIPAGFKDCCKISGWGRNLKLTSCNGEEEDLAEQRKLNKCVIVGTFCADKVLGVCTRKKTSYCCYGTKLSRIINEQGKAQLGIGFGSPEEPDCSGLTLDQLTRIDFSKLNLSELFSDLSANLKVPSTNTMNRDIQKSMANKTYTLTDKKQGLTQGRSHGNF